MATRDLSFVKECSHRIPWATREQWGNHQALIIRLYLVENRTLKEVTEIVTRCHMFKATEKMYKYRFKKWNLGPKNEIRKQMHVRLEAISSGVLGHILTQIPLTLTTPETLRGPERLLVTTRDYITVSFDDGNWASGGAASGSLISKKGGNDLNALNTMSRYHITACDLLEAGLFEEARCILDKASVQIQNIPLEHPQTLLVLFDVVMTIEKRKRHWISQLLLELFSSVAGILLGEDHPLGKVCGYLATVDDDHFQDILVISWKSLLDHFENRLGSMNNALLECRLRFSFTAEFPNSYDRGEKILRYLLRMFESTDQPHDPGCLYLLLDLEWNLPQHGIYDGAESICQDILHHPLRTLSNSWAKWFHITALYYLSAVQWAQCKIDAAVPTLQKIIDLNTSLHGGKHDPLTLKALAWLEICLMITGNEVAAAKTMHRIRTMVTAM